MSDMARPDRKMAPAVEAVFDGIDEPVKEKLLILRSMIFEVAEGIDEVGPLEECLKWGEPSYVTSESGSGTTLRINRDKKRAGGYAFYVNCQTSLIEEFRALYPDLVFGGNRSVLFSADQELPDEAVRHCIALTLTYHSRKKAKLD